MAILVTGGAGYIGAHIVRTLLERGEDVIVADDLSTGQASRIGTAHLVEVDVAAPGAARTLADAMSGVSAVIHMAARKQVGESVEKPEWYYQQNVGGLASVLTAMRSAGVGQLVFSSSAAAYGLPDVGQVTELTEARPINPYGETKLIGEWQARDAARAWGLRVCALRYFNVAGAGTDELGDPARLNLIPMVFEKLAAGQRPLLFGDDYDTPDGSCVRDYVHVSDLAAAHADALTYLGRDERDYDVFNVGTGQGSSVIEVINEIGKVSGLDATPEVRPRRAGDPAYLVGSPARIESEFGWHAKAGLSEIVASAWSAWQAGPDRIG